MEQCFQASYIHHDDFLYPPYLMKSLRQLDKMKVFLSMNLGVPKVEDGSLLG
jgi:hypothetical protein